MRTLLAVLRHATLATFLFFAGVATLSAHEGHSHAISKEAAMERASTEITRLVEEGKLDSSWKTSATLQTAELRTNGKAKEWALTFSNAQAAKESERTLYVFLSEGGKYLAANFTGR